MASNSPRTSFSWLPDSTNLEQDFNEPSFFQQYGPHVHLPQPQEVRAVSRGPIAQPDPVKFNKLGVIVKFGTRVTVEEAMCIWAIRRVLRNEVLVPEIYGWRVDGELVFIYMEPLQGDTLLDRWDSLTSDDRLSICEELRKITTSLRQLEQDPGDIFIGRFSSLWCY